ncbi:hypothetical protein [Pseudovibrio sp. FO-BEG1]|uniref:hypothetical protein n=1 Tax=Pseudovibrio sp. (strain FO-BEG1) TaxID=911045 RepID=UPI0011D26F2E|nr:hypothetical protein [Pseudovibrio sp. FO-BEG1]
MFQLSISQAWVLNKNDKIAVAGEVNSETGKFLACAYSNYTKGVTGREEEKISRKLFCAGVLGFSAFFFLLSNSLTFGILLLIGDIIFLTATRPTWEEKRLENLVKIVGSGKTASADELDIDGQEFRKEPKF